MATDNERRAVIKRRLAELPRGSLAIKTVKGREYTYLRWSEGGKRKERYVPAASVEAVRAAVDERKALEAELDELGWQRLHPASPEVAGESFQTNVVTGALLRSLAEPVALFKKRVLFADLWSYLEDGPADKVLVLCGLRRTGKTTLIRQALCEMTVDQFSRAAFIQVTPSDSLADLNKDMRRLFDWGYRFVFIDEVMLLADFVEGAALFSDIFATSGMRVVLSGTDSLGFLFAEDEQLYDRCVMVHTTRIPYREFEDVLGVRGIDEYIRYGGTMSLGGVHYNTASTFASKKGADEYVDSAIAHNIQHSLRCYQDGGHFRSLRGLHERNELTSAINRVVEDMNHRFTLEVLRRDFRSHDLAVSARNLRHDREHPTTVLDDVDIAAVTKRLRDLLEIRDSAERSVELTEAHCAEIEEYLVLLDLVEKVRVVSLTGSVAETTRAAIAQPGLRYAQVDALVQSLLADNALADLSLAERNRVLGRIRSEVKGRMMEDVVLMETAAAHPEKEVFVLQFARGEFDMVVFDPPAATCEICEIKHSAEVAPEQCRHLLDEEKCAATAHRYGAITGKYVLYRGESRQVGDVQYVNVEEYLRKLTL